MSDPSAGNSERCRTGIAGLDHILAGGFPRRRVYLVRGRPGTGKTTARRGGKAVIFVFDESIATLLRRADGLGIPVREFADKGNIHLQRVDAAELSPGQFIARVQEMVEDHGVRTVVVDSLNGFIHAMPSEPFLVIHMHELLSYLAHRGITTILTMAEHGLLGQLQAPVDLSYLADTVVVLRFFEHAGSVRKGISVMKRRAGDHEDTIREVTLVSGKGVIVGEPLRGFRNVLSGIPVFTGIGADMDGTGDAKNPA